MLRFNVKLCFYNSCNSQVLLQAEDKPGTEETVLCGCITYSLLCFGQVCRSSYKHKYLFSSPSFHLFISSNLSLYIVSLSSKDFVPPPAFRYCPFFPVCSILFYVFSSPLQLPKALLTIILISFRFLFLLCHHSTSATTCFIPSLLFVFCSIQYR
jgi:hypothetical protein